VNPLEEGNADCDGGMNVKHEEHLLIYGG